ncbi:aspartate aminotransferase family protein [bacterium]|nr:aspartate aminotransferase family protein [bacterium]
MTSILHRDPASDLPTAVSGAGCWLQDSDGRHYLDASGGAAVSAVGHGHPQVVEAIREQVARLAYAHTAFFTNAPSEALADLLIARAPPGFGRVVFTSGGSEATDAALKLARQFHLANGKPQRTVFIARRQSYHGATLGALAVSGHPARRAPYEPVLSPCRFIAPCYAYRERAADETPAAYARRAADALEAEIEAVGPSRVAAFIAEPVVGATLGAVPAEPGYLERIRSICDRHGVLFIADEVMCGMGRTGTTFAVEADGVAPDIITIAKGLGGGYQPIGAMLMSRAVADVVTRTGGRFEHGHTYIGHAIACAAALAVQQVIHENRLLSHVSRLGPHLMRELASALGPSGVVGDIRGRGLMIGVELVADPVSRTPFPAARRLAPAIKAAAFENGLIVYPGSGCADGRDGDHILIAPPYIVSQSETGEIADRLSRALHQALAATAGPARVTTAGGA